MVLTLMVYSWEIDLDRAIRAARAMAVRLPSLVELAGADVDCPAVPLDTLPSPEFALSPRLVPAAQLGALLPIPSARYHIADLIHRATNPTVWNRNKRPSPMPSFAELFDAPDPGEEPPTGHLCVEPLDETAPAMLIERLARAQEPTTTATLECARRDQEHVTFIDLEATPPRLLCIEDTFMMGRRRPMMAAYAVHPRQHLGRGRLHRIPSAAGQVFDLLSFPRLPEKPEPHSPAIVIASPRPVVLSDLQRCLQRVRAYPPPHLPNVREPLHPLLVASLQSLIDMPSISVHGYPLSRDLPMVAVLLGDAQGRAVAWDVLTLSFADRVCLDDLAQRYALDPVLGAVDLTDPTTPCRIATRTQARWPGPGTVLGQVLEQLGETLRSATAVATSSRSARPTPPGQEA